MNRVVLKTRVLRRHILRCLPSQAELAREVGISTGYCAQILAGNRSPSGTVRLKLLEVTGLAFDDLFVIEGSDELDGGEEPRQQHTHQDG